MKKLLAYLMCLIMLLSFAGFAEAEDITITVAHNQGEYIYGKFHEMGDKFTEMTSVKIEWLEIPSSDWDT
ncbi:MAG: hypothetical protein IJO53_01980, partial [Clostridia bacterium]|nr:hypothetical protein [Clostridia bacterium]